MFCCSYIVKKQSLVNLNRAPNPHPTATGTTRTLGQTMLSGLNPHGVANCGSTNIHNLFAQHQQLKLDGTAPSQNCGITRNRSTQICVVRVVRRIYQSGKSLMRILGVCIRALFFPPTLHAVAPARVLFTVYANLIGPAAGAKCFFQQRQQTLSLGYCPGSA